MASIGIFGGTFNPVHNGHIKIAESFKEQLKLDKLIIIPAKSPTHKDAKELAPSIDRLSMCRLVFNGDREEVSSIEIDRESKSYSYFTLKTLKEKYPLDTIYMLVGEDMFLSLLSWYRAEELLKLCIPCVAVRSYDGIERLNEFGEILKSKGSSYEIIEVPFYDISSTEIREAVKNNKSTEGLIPKAVSEYIKEKKLYLI